MLTISIVLFADIKTSTYINDGWSSKTLCRDGLLIERLEKRSMYIERVYCLNRSSWSHECVTEPVRCKQDKRLLKATK